MDGASKNGAMLLASLNDCFEVTELAEKSTARARVGVKDVAKAANVSIATVSYALNGRGAVSEDVREHVRRIATKMGYKPNTAAKAMRTGRTSTIGLLLPDLRNPFFPELAQAVENQARDAGYSVFLIDCQSSPVIEAAGAKRLIDQGVEGIVWCPCSGKDTLAEFKGMTPVVVIDRPMPNYDIVMSDYNAGGAALAEFLISSRSKNVGVISGPLELDIARLRQEALFNHLPQECTVIWQGQSPFSNLLSPEAEALCQRANEVDIVICGNDMIAVGAMTALKKLGYRIPEDVGVIGFDDIPWAEIVSPPLTTIRQSLGELGSIASRLLFEKIKAPNSAARHINVGVSLVVRGSVHI